jgi:PIN domain nuclease of toxin-antitoxin system
VNVLLDTYVALSWLVAPDVLSERAPDVIGDGANRVLPSAASVREAAIKSIAGKLDNPEPFDVAAAAVGIEELPVCARHARRAAALPPLHRDPFDRMLVAQALGEDLVIVARGAQVRQYEVATLPG